MRGYLEHCAKISLFIPRVLGDETVRQIAALARKAIPTWTPVVDTKVMSAFLQVSIPLC